MNEGDDGSAVALLRLAFTRAVQAAQPQECLARALATITRPKPALVLGAGKAAASMAATFFTQWPEPVRGLVVTRYGHGLTHGEETGAIEVVEAGHPSPDSASLKAGARLLELARKASHEEQIYWLVSGGGSSLAAAALPPLTFEQKRDAANHLMRAGADIRGINCVRKHLSGFKGGRLAAAARPHSITTFAISDVPGDDIAAIASGPTIADPTTQAQALTILEHYACPGISALTPVLSDPRFETPKPGDPSFADDRAELVATGATALMAARKLLEERGYAVLDLGDGLDDEAHVLGRAHAQLARGHAASGHPIAILSGGETRVVMRGSGGQGGRNLEYLAGLALGLEGAPNIIALAADTDGIDGSGGHAGGIVTPGVVDLGRRRGASLEECLAANDCYRFFEACDALVTTGPTRTNVNDFRLILCQP